MPEEWKRNDYTMPTCEGAEWYCPQCQHLFLYRFLGTRQTHLLDHFIDVTSAWMESDLRMCGVCSGFVSVQTIEPPTYYCAECDLASIVDLREIRAAALHD